MTTRNDVTGDPIKTRPTSEKYRDNFEETFGKKDDPKDDPEDPCDECGRDASTMGHDPWCSRQDDIDDLDVVDRALADLDRDICEDCGRDVSTHEHDPYCPYMAEAGYSFDPMDDEYDADGSFAGYCDCGRPVTDVCVPCGGGKAEPAVHTTKPEEPLQGPGGMDDTGTCLL